MDTYQGLCYGDTTQITCPSKGETFYGQDAQYTGNTGSYTDWRLPNAKELQRIADYSGVFPAIDTSFFNLTQLINIKGQTDYPFYWSSTSNPVEGSDGAVEHGTVYPWVLAAGTSPIEYT